MEYILQSQSVREFVYIPFFYTRCKLIRLIGCGPRFRVLFVNDLCIAEVSTYWFVHLVINGYNKVLLIKMTMISRI